jgi:acyl CoA:acetate/3-ketoacid CoA transferase alpha subunit
MLNRLTLKNFKFNYNKILFSNYSKKIYNQNETDPVLLESIQNHSNLYIGGYSHHDNPNILLKSLVNIKRNNLTIITNASIKKNIHLRNLLQINGKVNKFITSLAENKTNFLNQNQIQLELISNREFLSRFCYTDLFQKQIKHGISLIKSPYSDVQGNLQWPFDQPQYYNEKFAKHSFNTIAECNELVENRIDLKILPNFYVNKVVVNDENSNDDSYPFMVPDDEPNQDLCLINDAKIQVVIKRVIHEFYNDPTVYITGTLAYLFEKFYMPRHLNINLLNSYIDKHWPFNVEWLNCASNIDLCVIEASKVNVFGEVSFDESLYDLSQQQVDVANNSKGRLVVVIRELKHDSIVNERFREKIILKKADLVISDKAVFEIDKFNNQIQLIEYNEEFSELNEIMDCEFKINSKLVKPMIKSI